MLINTVILSFTISSSPGYVYCTLLYTVVTQITSHHTNLSIDLNYDGHYLTFHRVNKHLIYLFFQYRLILKPQSSTADKKNHHVFILINLLILNVLWSSAVGSVFKCLKDSPRGSCSPRADRTPPPEPSCSPARSTRIRRPERTPPCGPEPSAARWLFSRPGGSPGRTAAPGPPCFRKLKSERQRKATTRMRMSAAVLHYPHAHSLDGLRRAKRAKDINLPY